MRLKYKILTPEDITNITNIVGDINRKVMDNKIFDAQDRYLCDLLGFEFVQILNDYFKSEGQIEGEYLVYKTGDYYDLMKYCQGLVAYGVAMLTLTNLHFSINDSGIKSTFDNDYDNSDNVVKIFNVFKNEYDEQIKYRRMLLEKEYLPIYFKANDRKITNNQTLFYCI